ncbi:hypothetical protein Agub_g594, partial [Astrephomene gubernaculifera]
MSSSGNQQQCRRLGRWTTAEKALEGIDVKGKVAIVTGGSSGIGVETCRALAKAGARVYLCARDMATAERVAEDIKRAAPGSDVRLQLLDLCDLASVRGAAEQLRAAEPAVHMLILNAGVMACPLMHTKDGLEMQTGVNHVAHFYLTQLLLPALTSHGSPARVVSVSSSAHAFGGLEVDDLNWEARAKAGKYGPWIAYGQSKLCNVLFARELAKRLSGTQVSAFSLHPGIITTKLQRHQGWPLQLVLLALWPWSKTVKQGASTSIYAATAPELAGRSGAYLDNCRPARCSAAGADEQLAGRLWTATEALL